MKRMGKILALAALLTAAVGLMCGCGLTDYIYDDAEKYTAGNAVLTETISNVDIDWLDGSVTVMYGDRVSVSETSKKALQEMDLLRWWVDGDTLRVRYAEYGHHTYENMEKHLTVTLPAAVIPEMQVHTASGSVRLDRMAVKNLKVNTASGSVTALCAAENADMTTASGKVEWTDEGVSVPGLTAAALKLQVTTASGDVSLRIGRQVSEASIHTASGGFGAVLGSVSQLEVKTASGGVALQADSLGNGSVNTASGAVNLTVRDTAEQLDVKTASGGITLTIGPNLGMTADIGSSSGRITDALGMRQDNGHDVYGDGHARVTLHTSSGNINVEPWKEI